MAPVERLLRRARRCAADTLVCLRLLLAVALNVRRLAAAWARCNYDYLYHTLYPTELRGKVVVITGAAGGLGRQLSRLLAVGHGATVVMCDVDAEGVERAAEAIRSQGGRALCRHVDVTRPEQLDALADALHAGGDDAVGGVDIVICNAAVLRPGLLHRQRGDDVKRTMDVNATGTINTLRAFLPHMLSGGGGGHLVAMCSMTAQITCPGVLSYAASKCAVRGAMETLDEELLHAGAHRRVALTTVFPFFIRTELTGGCRPTSTYVPVLEAEHVAKSTIEAIRRRRRNVWLPHYMRYVYRLMGGAWPPVLYELRRTAGVSFGVDEGGDGGDGAMATR